MREIANALKDKVYEYSNDIIDAALDISLIIVAVFSLIGCANSPQPVVEKAEYHPTWPSPYKVCDVSWKVFVIEEEPYVALSFDDNLELAKCSLDLIRYVEELKVKFCHYRPEGDSNCVYQADKEKQ